MVILLRPPPLVLLLLVAWAIALPSCATAGSSGSAPLEQVTSEAALLSFLSGENYIVEQEGFVGRRIAGALGNRYRVRGPGSGALLVWTYEDAAQAERALLEVRNTGGMARFRTQRVHYQSGPLVVRYEGTDPGLRSDLVEALGSPR